MKSFVNLLLISLLILSAVFSQTAISADNSGFSSSSSSSNDLFSSLSSSPVEEETFLPVDDAFQFDFYQDGDTLEITWIIAEGYYLYRDKMKFEPNGATLGEVSYPPSEIVDDEIFGKSNVYFKHAQIKVPLSNVVNNAELVFKYQGCAEAGLCYPPRKQVIPLIPSKTSAVADSGSSETIQSEQDQLAQQLAGSNLLWTLLVFFGLGVGLSFTPCVFPMYPILAGIIAGRGEGLSAKNGLMLAFTYVQGMAITYAGLGLVVANLGLQFQAYFQHPAVLVSLSAIFVLLSLSMFGWFEIQLPSSWQERLTNVSNSQKGGSFTGVFVMGILSGLIASPCTTAPLSGALLYVAKSGDLVLGGITLYVLSLGMGIPLLLMGLSGGKLLPRAGQWMNIVKSIFGFILLGVPLILLDRIIDFEHTVIGLVVLSSALAVYLYHIRAQLMSETAKTAAWFAAMVLLIGSAMTVQNVFIAQPVVQQVSAEGHAIEEKNEFIDITNLNDLDAKIAEAADQGLPVMIDFYADWCVACKEFEAFTFTDPMVESQMQKFMLIRVNVTDNNDNDIELLENYDILGLPSILFFSPKEGELAQLRVTGFMDAEAFNQHLLTILSRS